MSTALGSFVGGIGGLECQEVPGQLGVGIVLDVSEVVRDGHSMDGAAVRSELVPERLQACGCLLATPWSVICCS